MPAVEFTHSRDELSRIAEAALAQARTLGADAAEVSLSEGRGLSVTVRRGALETLEYHRDKGLSVTVYVGRRRGHANSSDMNREAIDRTVAAAVAIARLTAEDEAAGLPDENRLADPHTLPDLSLFHPWALEAESAIELARACESSALAVDERITNSEGATVSTQAHQFVLANSLGFLAGYPTTAHSLSCSVIAQDEAGMERDYWWDWRRDPLDLEPAELIGRSAGRRAIARLGARRIPTGTYPVVLDHTVSGSLLSHFVQAASGGALYRKASFLLDKLGERIFSPHVTILEDPFILKAPGSAPFDDEGVATARRTVVAEGVLQGWFLSTYSGRKLGLPSTGNAGGAHNLLVPPTHDSREALLREMGRGLLVTELMGHGVNPVTGDYSRGAAGFWVENGEITHPVSEITIAGNLLEMFGAIRGVANDARPCHRYRIGSTLVEAMQVAGE
ncbi:MAG: metalloprotease PmbA [Tepidiphilus sp.]|nr:metalloprotease PmbA [Tepidiphilus sp.]MDD3432167.1 metalloprotease PmbA [Tepidiphilus sp.]